MSENQVLRLAWLAVGRMSRIFRLNSGTGWVPMGGGKAHKLTMSGFIVLKDGRKIPVQAGDAIVPGGRPIPLGFGMPNGKPMAGISDLVGWTTIVITADMVGSKIAAFTMIETKSSEDAERRAAQLNAIEQVKAAGGIAGFAHTPEMAVEIVTAFTPIR